MSPLNLYGRSSASLATLHPSAFLVEALDLLGRAHALQSRPVDVQDPRAMESRKDATSAITSAANRWYHDIQPAIGRMEDERPLEPLHLLTVSNAFTSPCVPLVYPLIPALPLNFLACDVSCVRVLFRHYLSYVADFSRHASGLSSSYKGSMLIQRSQQPRGS
jgi:hypothetical protein